MPLPTCQHELIESGTRVSFGKAPALCKDLMNLAEYMAGARKTLLRSMQFSKNARKNKNMALIYHRKGRIGKADYK